MRIRAPLWFRQARAAARQGILEDNGGTPAHFGIRMRAQVVPADELASLARARNELGLEHTSTVIRWAYAGYLAPAALDPATKEWGITRASLNAQVAWKREASWAARARRQLWSWLQFAI